MGASEMQDKSPSPKFSTSSLVLVGAIALTVGIFIIDTATTLDIAIAVLYVVVVFAAANFLQRRGVLLVAAGCVALAVLSFLLSHGLSADTALVRCFVSIAAIAATTYLALKNQSANTVLREQASLLDLTHDTIFVRDRNDVITYWNHGAEELYGWTRDEAVGQVSHQIMKTVFPEPLEDITAQLFRSGRWEGELIHTKRDGTRVTVASRWSLQQDERGRPIGTLETNNDISERKQADAELRASERRYRNIFQTAGVSIWEEDFSQVKAAIDDLKARGVRDFAQYLAKNPEFVQQAIAMVRIVNVNDTTVKLLGAAHKDELLVSLHKIFVPETEGVFRQELIAIAEGRTFFEAETVLRTLKGDRLSVLLTIAFPSETDTLDSVLVSMMDVTERERMNEALHQAQAELAHVTRVTTLGQLTASIAHEVNQPLAAIVTNGEACLRWLGHDPPQLDEVRGAVENMIDDGMRASEVVSGLRALSKKTEPQRTRLNLNDVTREVIPLVEREVFNHRVSLRLELAPALSPVLADRVQLQQVVMNLLINAIQAMASVSDRARELLIRSRQLDGDQVLIEVEDSGIGIAPENMSQLFTAFYTTKLDGMGMGLSICRSLIEAHGGRIWAARNAGPGATFAFTLPSLRETAA
jgi:PAS domain S-box-containing protein